MVASLPPPFPLQTAIPNWTGSANLAQCLRRNVRTGFGSMGIAVVDLTMRSRTGTFSSWVEYGGLNDDIQMQADSLPKMGVMFAAYRLREQVNAALKQVDAKTAADVLPQVEAAWRSRVEIAVPRLPKSFPNLQRIFEVNGGPKHWEVEFQDDGLDWNALIALADKMGDPYTSKLGFRDRMKLMMIMSDDRAAASCIRDIGYQYLNGAFAAEGLYDTTSQRGFWVSWDYFSDRTATHPKGGNAQSATALTVAQFLALVESDDLVSPAACKDMREIMSHQSVQAPLLEGLRKAKPARAPSNYYGKIGVVNLFSDCGVVKRTVQPGMRVRYAAVGLGAWNREVLEKLVLKLDDCIVANSPFASFVKKAPVAPKARW